MLYAYLIGALLAAGLLYLARGIPAGFSLLRRHRHPFRAFGKRLGHDTYSGEDETVLRRSLHGLFFLSLAIWLWVAILVWRTDYSFLIILFPFLMYYFGIRYFLWEKADLHEAKKKEEK